MKNFHYSVILSIQFIIQVMVSSAFSQAPDTMAWQAVIRDGNGEILAGRPVGIRIQIMQGSEFNGAAYVETHTATTGENGLITLEIGGGSSIVGSFNTINWEQGPYFLQTEIDPLGGSNYSISGTIQFLSVPYAFHAGTAEIITGEITETDPAFRHSVAWAITTGDTARWNNQQLGFVESDPLFSASVAKGITEADTINWNGKLSAESQTLSDILANNWDGHGMQIKNIAEPSDPNDAVNKAYADELLARINLLKYLIFHGDTVADIEGNIYQTIVIGDQVWMADNLKATVYNDGTPIPLVPWNRFSPGYSWYKSDEGTYKNPFGALYLWNTIGTGKLCPAGWHVSTTADWEELIAYAGGKAIAGGRLKEKGNSHWNDPNLGATDLYGFSALPGGISYVGGHQIGSGFVSLGGLGIYWTTEYYNPVSGVPYAMAYRLYSSRADIDGRYQDADSFASVRCVKDQPISK
jgi:uncharacterized protein (TIGR02145 family)